MPITGKNRKARPREVFTALRTANSYPRPGAQETFTNYMRRLEVYEHVDTLLLCLLYEGQDEPSQREYMRRLDAISEELHRVRAKLFDAWK